MSIRAAYSIGVVLTGSALFLVVVLLLFSGRQAAVHAPLQIARTPVEELEKDLSEVEAFIAASQRPAVKAELSREKANMEQQIARQREIIGTGDKMLQRAQRELSAGRIEQARVSIAGARSAFTRASASERLRDATRVEAQLAHFGNVADEPQRSPLDGAAGGQTQGQGVDDSSPTVTGARGTLAAATTAEKAAQTHAQTGALDQVGVTRPSWPSLPQTIHKAPAARWPLPEGTDGEWADGWARSRTASTPDALQMGSRSMLS